MVNDPGAASKADVTSKSDSNEAELRMLYGIGDSFSSNVGWFIDIEPAYLYRAQGGLSDQLEFDWTAGLKSPDNRVWLFLQQYNTRSINRSFANSADYDLYSISPSIIYWLTKYLALQTGYQQDLYGIDTGKGKEVFASVWFRSCS